MAISGKRGRVQYGGVDVGQIHSWSLDIAHDTHDVTSWTTDNALWRTNISGLAGWSGRISAFWDMENTASKSTNLKDFQDNILTPSTAAVKLFVDSSGGENYAGSCLISGQSVSVDIGGVASVDFDFQGTAALTYATAT